MRLRISFELNHPDLRRYIILTLPLMVGLTMTFSREFFFRIFGSYLPPGGISGINYGLKIMLIPVALFGQAIGTASYPFMARLVVEEKMEEMNNLLNSTLRYLALVIPVCVLLMVLRNEVVLIIYQRGQFDAAATALTADILIYLLAGAFALAAYTIVPRAYYAMQNTLFPAIYGSIAVLLSIPFYYMGLRFFGSKGIALAISLSGIFQVLVLYMLWNKRSDNQGSRQVYIFYIKMIFFSLLLFPLLSWFKNNVLTALNPATFSGSILVILVTGATFILIMGIMAYSLKIKEILDVAGKIVTYLKRVITHQ